MDQDNNKSSIVSWVAWVALVIGLIAFGMAWMAMNDTNNLRQELEQLQMPMTSPEMDLNGEMPLMPENNGAMDEFPGDTGGSEGETTPQ